MTPDAVQIDHRQILAALALTAEQAEAIVGAPEPHASRPNARRDNSAAGTPACPRSPLPLCARPVSRLQYVERPSEAQRAPTWP